MVATYLVQRHVRRAEFLGKRCHRQAKTNSWNCSRQKTRIALRRRVLEQVAAIVVRHITSTGSANRAKPIDQPLRKQSVNSAAIWRAGVLYLPLWPTNTAARLLPLG